MQLRVELNGMDWESPRIRYRGGPGNHLAGVTTSMCRDFAPVNSIHAEHRSEYVEWILYSTTTIRMYCYSTRHTTESSNWYWSSSRIHRQRYSNRCRTSTKKSSQPSTAVGWCDVWWSWPVLSPQRTELSPRAVNQSPIEEWTQYISESKQHRHEKSTHVDYPVTREHDWWRLRDSVRSMMCQEHGLTRHTSKKNNRWMMEYEMVVVSYMCHADAYFTLHSRWSFDTFCSVGFQKSDIATQESSG